MKVSNLTKEEVRIHDNLLLAISALADLKIKQRKNIYKRLEMLNIFTPQMTNLFELNVKRINK